MPLRDHFHSPLDVRLPWESLHSNWATRIADLLNDRWLPSEFVAEEYPHSGSRLEIDVATFQESAPDVTGRDGSPAVAIAPPTWAPPAPARTIPGVFPDSFEVRVFSMPGGRTLVGAIELISPGNKDRPEERRAFATKCASYLYQGVALVVIDVVTSRRANLHDETMRLMQAAEDTRLPAEVELYAVAYRPVRREGRAEIDLWPAACRVGEPLPVMPLRLTGDSFVPVDFEATYQEACRRRRLA